MDKQSEPKKIDDLQKPTVEEVSTEAKKKSWDKPVEPPKKKRLADTW